MNCPHCGAPPPPGFVPPAGQFAYRCTYCNQSATLGTPVAASQVPTQTGAIYIVEHNYYGNDDDDDDDDHRFYPTPVVYAPSRSWVIYVVVVLLISAGGGGGFWRYRRGSVGSQILNGTAAWNGNAPLVCGGNDDIQISGVTATFNAGAAIQAGGNCHVQCTDCNITAPTVVDASGNAEVVLTNGTLKGTTLLANAEGNSHVTISGNVTAAGATKHSSNATVSAPTPPPVAKAAPKAPAAAQSAPAPVTSASGSAPTTAKAPKRGKKH